MRIAFYAPLKAPSHAVPSGDRRVARLYIDALERCGHQVTPASGFRSFDSTGDVARQRALRDRGLAEARALLAGWRAGRPEARPELWFTYHVYHKAPDWLGPLISRELGIPYLIAEPSHAPKRAMGPWALGYEGACRAICQADLLICPIRDDVACLEALPRRRGRILFLPPFLDASPFRSAGAEPRAVLATRYGLDPKLPWIVTAAMMRPGDKLASYRALADVLARVKDLPWQLLVAGDGACRNDVEYAFEAAVPGRVKLLGALEPARVAALFSSCDLYVWPGINEAYGMALLEAQAAGLAVVSSRARGIPDVVDEGRTALLALPGDASALADRVRSLLLDESWRRSMGRAAAEFVFSMRGVEAAALRLGAALREVVQ